MALHKTPEKVKLPLGQVLNMIGAYAKAKIVDQIKSVSLIVAYLVLFQVIVLNIPVANSLVVASGIGVVVLGLTFFMEGLSIGLMPLGETCGIRLPQKTVLPVILLFAFILGLGATFAEPAIGVLKSAGSSVKAWDAPLLFLLLNKYSGILVGAVGIGVGVAVMFGMLRFLYSWSLKPFIYTLYAIISSVSIWAYFDPNLVHITGLAWDCGGVTTGPVTVPLVLALGIGISRVAAKKKGGEQGAAGGFGVVTLASAFPIIAVLGLGVFYLPTVPQPADDVEFCSPAYRDKAITLFANEDEMQGYVLKNGSPEAHRAFFAGDVGALDAYVIELASDEGAQAEIFGSTEDFKRWLLSEGRVEQQLKIYGSDERISEEAEALSAARAGELNIVELLQRNGVAALRAIVPLSAFLLFTLLVVLREKVLRADEILLGIAFAVIGMCLFSIGIELGLQRLGGEIGTNLPTSFKSVEMSQQREVISNFDPTIVSRAVTEGGQTEEIFSRKVSDGYEQLPYRAENYDPRSKQYSHTPILGPLFGSRLGIVVVIVFGFVMGYSATMAEPALNVLGGTVEELTVGTFKKSLLMQAVAIGVGVGIACGVAKIIYGWPVIWMLVLPYAVLMVLTVISSEDFVNIGWDSAGVTTGPVTVPLVLAMGLGISSQVGGIEGFGILSLASVFPILSVLTVGLYVTGRHKAELEESA